MCFQGEPLHHTWFDTEACSLCRPVMTVQQQKQILHLIRQYCILTQAPYLFPDNTI